MNELERLFSEHKTAFLIAGGALLFLILLRRSGSGASSPATAALGYAAQTNELNAQLESQQSQIAAQSNAVNAQAQVQNYAVQQSAAAQNYNTEASLIAHLYDTKQGAAVSEDQLGAEQHVIDTEYNTQLQAYETGTQSQDYQAELLAELYRQGLGDQYNLQLNQQQNQNAINQKIVNTVQAAGLNHGTESLENSLVGILSGVEGYPQIGVAAANASAVNSAASAQTWSSFWNGLFSSASKTLTSVFA